MKYKTSYDKMKILIEYDEKVKYKDQSKLIQIHWMLIRKCNERIFWIEIKISGKQQKIFLITLQIYYSII